MINKGGSIVNGSTKGVRPQGTEGHSTPGNSVGIYLWALVAILGMTSGNFSVAYAVDPIPAHIASGLQAGVVTSVESRSLFINGKEYAVDPEVEIRDQEDNVFPPEVVKRDQEVKFHLKKGAGNTIDFLIVYMPQ